METTPQPDRLLRPGMSYELPPTACSTPARINPDYPTIYERNATWVRGFLPFPDATALSALFENRYPLWESLIFPTGSAERVFHSSCITSLMFEVDDVGFLHHALFAEVAADWVADHPYGRAFTDIWATFHHHMPEGVYQRYRQAWQDAFTYMLEENEFRARNEIPDVDTYLEIRRFSVGLHPYIACTEYVLDLDLTELVEVDPELREAQRLAVEHAVLTNDLYSYRWECFKGDYFNIISPLLHVHGNDLQEAVNITCDKIRQADEKLMQLSGNLRRRYASGPQHTQLHSYIDALGAFCAGNLRWSLETSRYNGHGYGWNGLRSGTVTLDPQQTIIEPV